LWKGGDSIKNGLRQLWGHPMWNCGFVTVTWSVDVKNGRWGVGGEKKGTGNALNC